MSKEVQEKISYLDAHVRTGHYSGMSWIAETGDGVVLEIHATPRASRNQIQGFHGESLKIRLKAPPVEGKANAALINYLAEVLDIPRRKITLLSGQTSRQKRVLIRGITSEQARHPLMNADASYAASIRAKSAAEAASAA
jgi:uncharacterized protein